MNRLINQPLYPALPDQNHPALAGSSAQIIGYGNASSWSRNAGALIVHPTIGGTAPTSADTEEGSGIVFNGTDNYLDYGTANIPTQEFTFLWGGIFTSVDNFRGLIDCVSGANGWTIFQSGTDTLFFSINGYGGVTSLSGWTAGQFWNGAVRWKTGGEHAWFRNGQKLSSSSVALTPGTSIASLRIGWQRGGGTVPLKGPLAYGYLLDKWLDDQNIISLQNNPWQIFEQEPEIIYYPASSGTNYTLTASPGSFAITGTAAALKYNRVLPASPGSFAVSGTAASLKRGYSLQAASGSVSVSGTAASLKLGRVLQAGSGSVAVTGTSATLSVSSNKTLQADSGVFAVTGSAATLKISRVLPASAGSVQVNGTAASLKYNRILSAEPGSFAISGTDATLTYQTAGNRTLVAEAGSFAISGGAASLRIGRKLSAAPGAFAFTGAAATLRYARKVIAEAGAFSITGTAAALSKSGGAVSASRTYTVPVEERIFAVPAENRTYTVKL